MFVRRSLAALSVVSVLFVAACSEEPEPIFSTPTPTPTVSTPSPTETATVDPLAIPAAAKKPTKAGAEALVRHFYAMVNHLIQTGDAKPVRKTFGNACGFCDGGVASYESVFEQGHSLDGGIETIVRIRAALLDSQSNFTDAYVEVTIESTPQAEKDAQGQVVNRFPKGTSSKDFYLSFQNGRWSITNVEDPR